MECWRLVVLQLGRNVADCSHHQLGELAALLRLLSGLARHYPARQAAAVFWKFETSKVVVGLLGQACQIVLSSTFEPPWIRPSFQVSLLTRILVMLSLLKRPALGWKCPAGCFEYLQSLCSLHC